MKASTLALAATASYATAQNTTTPTSSSSINIQSANNYSGSSLIGYHVGAALSYMVAASPGSGNSFTYNSSATSNQLLDNDIAAGYPLPCYVVVSSEISDNSGPLECGAGVQPGDYNNAAVATSTDPTPGAIAFAGIDAWFVCAVQSFTYGWVQRTVVGAYAAGQPSGPGVENCTTIDGLVLVSESNSTTTTSSATQTSTSATSSSTVPTTVVTLPCPSKTASNATHISSFTTPTPTSPVAPFTGAASAIDPSAVLGLACAAALLLL